MLCAVGLATIPSQPEKKAADAVRDELQPPASRENIVKLLARREKPANALGRGSKLFIHPAEAPENNSIARVCHEAQDLALGEKSAAHQRAQKIWMRCSNAGKLQQPLVSCEIVTSSLEILPRRPSDEAKNCASPCGGNVSKTHGLGKKSPAVSS